MTNSLDDKLRHIVQHAYANAPMVKTIFDQSGLTPGEVQSLDDLDKIPVTSKDRLVQLQQEKPPFGGFLAVPMDRLEHVFFSPGPLYEPHAGESAVMDTIREMFEVAGFGTGDMVINAFGYHLIPTGLAVDEVLRETGATVIPAGVGNADLQIKMMLDMKATGYIGTPSWLMALIEKAEETGLDFVKAFSLKKALVSAEPLSPQMRQAFVEKYNLNLTNAYGTAELGFLAYDNEGGMAMRLLESSIIQVTNPETGEAVGAGETGEVVVTTFNETYPLIRLGTGDLAMNVDPAPGESRQGERSIILVGRVGEAVKVRGMFVHPNQLRFAVGQVPGVKGFQARVTRPENRDSFTLRVALADESLDRQTLTETLSQVVQSACRVKVDQVKFVPSDEFDEDAEIIADKRTWK
jgi:phenylacetate-CoA ligase